MSRTEREAAEWFARMRRPDSADHQAAFDAWKRDPANAAAYARAERDWLIAGGIARPTASTARRSPAFAPGRLGWAMAALAAVAISLALAWQVVGQRGTREQIAVTAPGETRLSDGSRVTLMNGARIATAFTADERRLILRGGRARFAVAHDASRPFIVVAGGSETKALGTIFEIDLTRPGAPRVALIEGSVEISRPASKAPALRLRPGQRAEVPDAGPRLLDAAPAPAGVALSSPVAIDAAPPTMIDVDATPLAEVVARANRVNAVQIRLADPGLGKLGVTGRFDVSDGASLARKLAAALDLAAAPRADGVVLRAK